jgi:VanZ family protein
VKAFRVALPVYWLALAVVTHYPHVRLPDEVPQSDKLVHFAAFGLLAFLFRHALRTSLWIAACVLIAYASVDEYTQQFVGRYTDFADWLANVAGIVSVIGVLELRRRFKAR